MSYDILTSNIIASALQTLLFSNDRLDEAQKLSSTGLRIESAKDNPGYWSTAMSLKSDSSLMTSIADALNLSESTVNIAYTAATTVLDMLSEFRAELTTLSESSTDRSKVATMLDGLKSSIRSAVETANFAGSNWLLNSDAMLPATRSIAVSFQRGANGYVSLTSLALDAASATLIDTADPARGLLTGTIDANTLVPDGSATPRNYYFLDSGEASPAGAREIAITDDTTQEELNDILAAVNYLEQTVTQLAARLGDILNRITTQTEFAKSLSDAMDKSVSRLIDADMEEVGVRLSAAKTQQALASEIVSLANTNQQALALLFR